ncbi:hypothetical protein [Kaistia sp. MMO-174]|uniref:hypothetical protein n=1 Tax=Kaistia sp. MMO-174 TaxID=3081256 RepID=UPI00301A6897
MSASSWAVAATGAAFMLCGLLCLAGPTVADMAPSRAVALIFGSGVVALWFGAELIAFAAMRGA